MVVGRSVRRDPNRRQPTPSDWLAMPLHPVLLAAYAVLFLFATNASDQVTIDPLCLPLLLAVAGAVAVLGVAVAFRRDALRGGLVAAVVVASFFGYGHAWYLVGEMLPGRWALTVPWLLLTAGAAVLAWSAGAWARRANVGLNVMTFLLVAFGVGGLIGPYLAQRLALDGLGDHGLVARTSAAEAGTPDVYYLVFDRYAREDVLAELFDYDNGPFIAALEERGFYVAPESYANYSKTPLSLVSSLSMDYLDAEQLKREARNPADRDPIHRRLRGSLPVPAALKDLGYTYHHVANWWEPSATNADADVVYRDEGPTEFATVLVETTLVSALWQAEQIDPFDWRVYRGHHEYSLGVLKSIADRPGPKYVFAHLLLPHEPYVFEPDGSPTTKGRVAERGERESYRRQLDFLNGQIIEIVDRILASSRTDPIIIIQADEGPFPPRYRADDYAFDWRGASDDELEEKWAILNAYRLPGVEPADAGLYPSISPVNTFRVVFNAYFGTDLPLLPDRMYAHVSQAQFYDFFEITDRLVSR